MVKVLNNKILYTICIVILITCSILCTIAFMHHDSNLKQTRLMGFKIVNSELDSLINMARIHSSKDSINTLLFYYKRDTMSFVFSYTSKEYFQKTLVDCKNYRIIGYTENKSNQEYWLLTNINEILSVPTILSKYIEPMYQYKDYDLTFHTPLDSIGWNYSHASDAISIYVRYVDEKIDSIYLDYDPQNE